MFVYLAVFLGGGVYSVLPVCGPHPPVAAEPPPAHRHRGHHVRPRGVCDAPPS